MIGGAMKETKIFEDLTKIKGPLEIKITNHNVNPYRPTKIHITSTKGSITGKELDQIISTAKSNKAKYKLTPFGVIEIYL